MNQSCCYSHKMSVFKICGVKVILGQNSPGIVTRLKKLYMKCNKKYDGFNNRLLSSFASALHSFSLSKVPFYLCIVSYKCSCSRNGNPQMFSLRGLLSLLPQVSVVFEEKSK